MVTTKTMAGWASGAVTLATCQIYNIYKINYGWNIHAISVVLSYIIHGKCHSWYPNKPIIFGQDLCNW